MFFKYLVWFSVRSVFSYKIPILFPFYIVISPNPIIKSFWLVTGTISLRMSWHYSAAVSTTVFVTVPFDVLRTVALEAANSARGGSRLRIGWMQGSDSQCTGNWLSNRGYAGFWINPSGIEQSSLELRFTHSVYKFVQFFFVLLCVGGPASQPRLVYW